MRAALAQAGAMSDATMSPTEVASFLGFNTKTVLRMLRDGRLPGTRVGRRWVVMRQALLSHLRAADTEGDAIAQLGALRAKVKALGDDYLQRSRHPAKGVRWQHARDVAKDVKGLVKP